jgi:HAD superfamily hydrolase (TIGR01490 family)
MKPFAVFDIDGTLIRWQLYHATADALVRMGYFDKDVFNEVRRARVLWKRRAAPFSDYEELLVSVYARLLSGVTTAQFDEAVESVYNEYKDQAYKFTRDIIKDLKSKGYLLFAISGSQAEVVSKVAKHYGFDDCVGSEFERKGEGFSGKVVSHRQGKHILLEEFVKKHGATYKGSYAVGDSEGDITMLEAVDNPIAFNPTEKLFVTAKIKGWPVVIERKNVIYKLKPDNGTFILA